MPEGEDPPDVAPEPKPPSGVSLLDATKRVLSIRSNRLLVVASALGYFYLTGAQTFIVVFLRHRFDLSQSAASGMLAPVGVGRQACAWRAP